MPDSKLRTAENEVDLTDDEIEIIEIVGFDEDSASSEFDQEDDGDRDLVISLDEADPADSGPSNAEQAERLVRLQADFENLKKRVDRERVAHERLATAQLVTRLLPVLDNFERALGTAREVGTEPGFCEGVGMIFRQMLEELRKEGLAAVDTVGETFNPEVHEAVATTDDPSMPPNTVVEELQRGYILHDRLLRPALVRVTLDAPGTTDKIGEC